jgi:hypothetical protein
LLNQFIEDAKQHLPNGKEQLVVIADSLDRIVPVSQSDGRTNHEHIFVDYSEQLTALNCHMIYTVPISMVYSHVFLEARNNYGTDAQVLPMVMVRDLDGTVNEEGLKKLKELVSQRVYVSAGVPKTAALESHVFESREVLEMLCLMSGGHVRELLILLKAAAMRSGSLPITRRAAQRSISDTSNTYAITITNEMEWSILASVHVSKKINKEAGVCRSLLFRRCLLEYRYQTPEGKSKCWYDINPLIAELDEFQTALEDLQNHGSS